MTTLIDVEKVLHRFLRIVHMRSRCLHASVVVLVIIVMVRNIRGVFRQMLHDERSTAASITPEHMREVTFRCCQGLQRKY